MHLVLVLDTHTLVWLDEGDPRLGKKALQAIDEALVSDQLGVASISFWEIAMLVRKGRLDIQMELDVWRSELLGNGFRKYHCRAQPLFVPVSCRLSTVIPLIA